MKIVDLNKRKNLLKCIRKLIASMLLITLAHACTACSDKEDAPEIYMINFETDGGTPVPATQRVEAGSTATAPTTNPAKSGYVFAFWHLSGSTTAYNFQAPVESNITLHAFWQEEAHTEYWQVTWNLDGGTWPSDDNHAAQVVKGGTLSEPIAPVKSGFDFDGWYKEPALTHKIAFPYDVSSSTSDIILYAKWTKNGGGETPEDVAVYTAGYYVNSNNKRVACYWINNTKYDLTDGSGSAQALDITVVNDVVYTAGYYMNGSTLIPCYWINDKKYELCDMPDYGEALAIEVYDGKVYTAGYCNTSDNKRSACYWVNQEKHILYTLITPTSTRYAIARDIAVIDGNVYACGTYNFGKDKIACYWVGSTKYDLQSTNYDSYAYSMYYTGSGFYIAGSYGDGRPCYFETELDGYKKLYSSLNTNQTGGYAYAKDICISGNDVYTVGYRGILGTDEALFWKNNTVEQIIGSDYSPGTAKSFTAESISISGDVIYIAGNNHNNAACYWTRKTDGNSFEEHILSDNGKANAIIIK